MSTSDEIICWCINVSKRTIIKAVLDGADNLEAIRKATGACTVGRCKELSPHLRCCSGEIKQLLETDISILKGELPA